MPATQHDLLLWVSGSAYDVVVFDVSRAAMASLTPVATLAHEVSSWPYQNDRDLTGFIDGTENPSPPEAAGRGGGAGRAAERRQRQYPRRAPRRGRGVAAHARVRPWRARGSCSNVTRT